uniref:Uncharacterized protein n=1 Tax=Pygocentrus nattereri TaxID=42514 RepID=A0AAR2KJN1_PYGNA
RVDLIDLRQHHTPPDPHTNPPPPPPAHTHPHTYTHPSHIYIYPHVYPHIHLDIYVHLDTFILYIHPHIHLLSYIHLHIDPHIYIHLYRTIPVKQQSNNNRHQRDRRQAGLSQEPIAPLTSPKMQSLGEVGMQHLSHVDKSVHILCQNI